MSKQNAETDRKRAFESAGLHYRRPSREVRVYIDTVDWWVGYYRGPNHHYVCPLPTLVIRWNRCNRSEREKS